MSQASIPIAEALREAEELGLVLPDETTVLTLALRGGEWVVVLRGQHPMSVPFQTYQAEIEGQGWQFALSWWQSQAPQARAAMLYRRSPTPAASASSENKPAGETALAE